MKTFTVDTNLKRWFQERIFRIYLFLSLRVEETSTKQRYYDRYGVIDTLGWSVNQSRITFSYSDEFAFKYAFKFLWFWIGCVDGECKYIVMTRNLKEF